MAKQRKIQDYDWLYSFLRHYVDFALKLSYRQIRYVGRERLPKDGAIIFAPNHTNALMDALVVLAMDRRPKVFVARADIFRNPTFAKILTFLKILPIMRMRDGMDEVRKNNETIDKAVDVLRDKVPFCIFPEGTHQTKYSTLPLAKGIFRIAMQAQDRMPDMPLYIVPLGLRYGNFFRFRSTCRVQIGEPIDVRAFLAENSEKSESEQMKIMRDELTERMISSIFYIPDDEDYDATYEICAAVVKQRVRLMRKSEQTSHLRGLDAHFEANNFTVKQIIKMKAESAEEARRVLDLGAKASQLRHERGISLASVSVKYPFWSRVLKGLFLIVALPYSIPASLLTLPINAFCQFVFSKLKDEAFRNSVRYLANLILWLLLMIIYSVIAYVVLPWQLALPLTLALLPAPIIAHETWRLIRLVVSDLKLLISRDLRGLYEEIRGIIFRDE